MKKTKRKKETGFVCVLCGKKKKTKGIKNAVCCGKDMLKKEGVWPD